MSHGALVFALALCDCVTSWCGAALISRAAEDDHHPPTSSGTRGVANWKCWEAPFYRFGVFSIFLCMARSWNPRRAMRGSRSLWGEENRCLFRGALAISASSRVPRVLALLNR